MSSIAIPRAVRHAGATGKTRQPTLAVGTCTDRGAIAQVRKRTRKHARHYGFALHGQLLLTWLRRDEFTVVPCHE